MMCEMTGWKMTEEHCPNCGSGDVATRVVNDRLRAADPRGRAFELALQLPMCRCRTCKFCWQGKEALAATEAAYQHAISRQASSPVST